MSPPTSLNHISKLLKQRSFHQSVSLTRFLNSVHSEKTLVCQSIKIHNWNSGNFYYLQVCIYSIFPNNRPLNKTGLTYLKTFYLYLLDFDLLSKISDSLHTMVIEITRVQFGLKIKSTGLSLEAMRQQKPTSCQTILVLKERKKYFWTDYSSIYVWITKLTQICPRVLEIISQRV